MTQLKIQSSLSPSHSCLFFSLPKLLSSITIVLLIFAIFSLLTSLLLYTVLSEKWSGGSLEGEWTGGTAPEQLVWTTNRIHCWSCPVSGGGMARAMVMFPRVYKKDTKGYSHDLYCRYVRITYLKGNSFSINFDSFSLPKENEFILYIFFLNDNSHF